MKKNIKTIGLYLSSIILVLMLTAQITIVILLFKLNANIEVLDNLELNSIIEGSKLRFDLGLTNSNVARMDSRLGFFELRENGWSNHWSVVCEEEETID